MLPPSYSAILKTDRSKFLPTKNPSTVSSSLMLGFLLNYIWVTYWQSFPWSDILDRLPFQTEAGGRWLRVLFARYSDTSYIPITQGTLCLSVIRDLFDLSIVAYKTSTRQSIKLVLDTIRTAIEKEEVTAELLLHSDQGFQYASQSYFALTTQYGITPSM